MAAVRPHQGIICSDLAHIHLDECNAPEKLTGGTGFSSVGEWKNFY